MADVNNSAEDYPSGWGMPGEQVIVFRQLSQFLRWRQENGQEFGPDRSVGLISTKGSIHEGHLELGIDRVPLPPISSLTNE